MNSKTKIFTENLYLSKRNLIYNLKGHQQLRNLGFIYRYIDTYYILTANSRGDTPRNTNYPLSLPAGPERISLRPSSVGSSGSGRSLTNLNSNITTKNLTHSNDMHNHNIQTRTSQSPFIRSTNSLNQVLTIDDENDPNSLNRLHSKRLDDKQHSYQDDVILVGVSRGNTSAGNHYSRKPSSSNSKQQRNDATLSYHHSTLASRSVGSSQNNFPATSQFSANNATSTSHVKQSSRSHTSIQASTFNSPNFNLRSPAVGNHNQRPASSIGSGKYSDVNGLRQNAPPLKRPGTAVPAGPHSSSAYGGN